MNSARLWVQLELTRPNKLPETEVGASRKPSRRVYVMSALTSALTPWSELHRRNPLTRVRCYLLLWSGPTGRQLESWLDCLDLRPGHGLEDWLDGV